MKDTKIDERLRSAKPMFQPRAAFTARVMKRIGAVQTHHNRRRRFMNIWTWTTTTAAVFTVVTAVIFMPSRTQNQDQAIKNPQESQTADGSGVLQPDDTNDLDGATSSRYEQLAQSTQEDIDTITRELGAIDATEYEDAGLSEAALY